MRREQTIKRAVRAALLAFAAGDAMGMPTEFMRPEDIRERMPLGPDGLPEGLLPPERSYTHADLPAGSVTDDTEQNLYLLAEAKKRGGVSVEGTVEALKAWIRETDAVAKHYIGPSSVKALKAIDEGVPAGEAGMGGTTCGGIMRTPSAVLWDLQADEETLVENITVSLLPTHNTSEALEAAGAYGFALQAAFLGAGFEEIFRAAGIGAEKLMARAPYVNCAPSSAERIRRAKALAKNCRVTDRASREKLLKEIFDLWGTGLPSADVAGAVFLIFALAKKDVWLAVRLSSILGGDTDTIGALAGCLSAAYAGGHNIPETVIRRVLDVNRTLFEAKYPEALS